MSSETRSAWVCSEIRETLQISTSQQVSSCILSLNQQVSLMSSVPSIASAQIYPDRGAGQEWNRQSAVLNLC